MPPLRLLAAVLALLAGSPAAAQVAPDTLDAPAPADGLAADAVEDLALAEGDAELLGTAETVADVNRAPATVLARLPGMDARLAAALVAYRDSTGGFGSLDELGAVPGFTPAVVAAVRPWLRLAPAVGRPYPAGPTPRRLLRHAAVLVIHRATRRLDACADADYLPPDARGSPTRLYTRLRLYSGPHAALNLTLEKDPGEAFAWDRQRRIYGYDHVGGHAAIAGYGRLRRLVVGDYVAAYGQGLLFWRGVAFGKGRAAVDAPVRAGRGVVPYASAAEAHFLRGAAVAVHVAPPLVVTAFASRRRLDAAPADAAPAPGGAVLPPRDDGLHRTEAELARKGRLRERLAGGAFVVEARSLRVGLAGYAAQYDPPVAPAGEPHRGHLRTGRSAGGVSAFGQAAVGALELFGEAARDHRRAVAATGGLRARPADGIRLVVAARRFPAHFVAPYGHAFGEQAGPPHNERGLYLGLDVRPAPRWHVAAYVDQYRFPWLRAGVAAPSGGVDALVAVGTAPRPWMEAYVLGRWEERDVDAAPGGPGPATHRLAAAARRSLRLQLGLHPVGAVRLNVRMEAVQYRESGEAWRPGALLYQELLLRPGPALQLSARIAVFDASHFGARLYTYEHDLRYTFAVPAWTGAGRRSYVLLRARPRRGLNLELKYGVTRFRRPTDDTDGERAGALRRDVRMQVIWQR